MFIMKMIVIMTIMLVSQLVSFNDHCYISFLYISYYNISFRFLFMFLCIFLSQFFVLPPYFYLFSFYVWMMVFCIYVSFWFWEFPRGTIQLSIQEFMSGYVTHDMAFLECSYNSRNMFFFHSYIFLYWTCYFC